MCFSSTASFSIGAVITGIGFASLARAEKKHQKAFAAIPLIFGVQQIAEGLLWVALENNIPNLELFSTYFFLLFAQVVWPIWVPLSFRWLDWKRKTSLDLLSVFGIGVAVYLAYCLFNYHVEGRIEGYHIYYDLEYPPSIRTVGGFIYLTVTIAPPFFSSIKKLWILGSSILVSYILTFIFYEDYVVSVWCFFSAIISVIVLYYVNRFKNVQTG